MRAVLGVLFALFTSSTLAEWIKYFESDSYYEFIDYSTIRKYDNMRRVWILQNVKNPRYEWKSQRYYLEIDCKEVRSRTLETTMHSEFMATGKVTYSSMGKVSDWRYMPPGSTTEALYKIVCEK